MRPRRATLVPLAAAALVACDGGDLTLPGSEADVSLSVVAPVPPEAVADAGGVTYRTGSDELRLTRVALVLREIELERVEGGDCLGSGSDDGCEEFETGPYLLELPLDGSVQTVLQIRAPSGVYDELELEIHKPDDDSSDDVAFLQSHPEFEGVSIRVEGTWNGEPFIFVQDADEEQERDLVPPLEVAGDGVANVTLSLDVSTWFVGDDQLLIDPRTALAGEVNEDEVEENIEASIEAFEDEDHDGRDDGD